MKNKWDLVLQIVVPIPRKRSIQIDYDRNAGFGFEIEGRSRPLLFMTIDTARFGLRIDI
jgi:hypothetical protein